MALSNIRATVSTIPQGTEKDRIETYEFEDTVDGRVGRVVRAPEPVVDVLAETLRVGAGLVTDFAAGEVATDEAEGMRSVSMA